MMADFVHLHTHSEYSLLDGLSRPEQLIEVAEENEQKAISITDHGSLAGYYRFQEAASKTDVKPVFGLESYFVPDIKNDGDSKAERFHLILLAENDEGMQNLFKINRAAWTDGFYHKPRTDFALLRAHSDGIIALSGCMGGSISQAIINDDLEHADELLDEFLKIYGKDFYLELQPWTEPDQQKVNKKLIEYSEYRGVPMVGTIDCHYPRKSDRGVEEALLAIGISNSFSPKMMDYAKDHLEEAKTEKDVIDRLNVLWPERRLTFQHLPLYVMPTNEVETYFTENVSTDPQLLENSMEIAERCSATLKKGIALLPSYPKSVGVSMSAEEYLSDIAYFRLSEMGLDNEKYREVLQMELDIIIDKKFADYFLILWDICKWAKNNGIAMGPGRGSSGGSLLAYCLGITKVDPVKYNLLFWRFLNPERNDYPDIDIDFEDRRRDEIKQYVRDRWGTENVASISTYGYFKEKSAFKSAARIFGVPYKDANAISSKMKDMDSIFKMTDKVAKDFIQNYSDALVVADGIKGTIQQAGAHAAGVVISPRPLHEILPIESRNDPESNSRIEVTAFDKNEIEQMGLVKFDALGLNTVSVIKDTLEMIKKNHGLDVESQSLDDENIDPMVMQQLSAGNTVGVFQSEGIAYTNVLKDLKAETFNDLIVANGLIRPGSWETQGAKYKARKQGAKVTYVSPILEPILGDTYGTWVFEEQLMRTLVELAGFSWGKADRFRKIISKKLDASEFDPYKDSFMEGATKNLSQKDADDLWADILKACDYMFNKSHSVAYSLLTYQTAWLKFHYPTEYIWALLTNESNTSNITTYLFEAQKLGVDILPPDVNLSEQTFTLSGNTIRFGLGNVMGCGPNAVQEIIDKRPFQSYEQFVNTCSKTRVKSNVVENLEKIGAFESVGHETDYDTKSYYGPVLNYPVFLNGPSVFDDILSTCQDVLDAGDSSELFVVRGVVKETKRTDRYYRVDIEDDTGFVSVFADQNMNFSKRDSILALVGDSALHYAIEYDKAEVSRPKFVRFMDAFKAGRINDQYRFLFDADTGYDLESDKTIAYLLSVTVFKTKKGQDMANAYFWNPVEGFFKTVIFPGTYNFTKDTLSNQFQWVILQVNEAKGGGTALNKAISPERYCKLKSIPHAPMPLFSSKT